MHRYLRHGLRPKPLKLHRQPRLAAAQREEQKRLDLESPSELASSVHAGQEADQGRYSSQTNLSFSFITRRIAKMTASGLNAAQKCRHHDCETATKVMVWDMMSFCAWPLGPQHHASRLYCHAELQRGVRADGGGGIGDEATDEERASDSGQLSTRHVAGNLPTAHTAARIQRWYQAYFPAFWAKGSDRATAQTYLSPIENLDG